jgi:hypothetical protein
MRRFVGLLALATALGCGGDSATNASDTVSGTYTLRTVNGAPLPFAILQIDSLKVEIISDAFTLTDNRTWTRVGANRTTDGSQVTNGAIADSGTYVLNGTKITVISSNGSTDGTVAGGKLTLTNDAVVALYQK